jgi:hypothetical protein
MTRERANQSQEPAMRAIVNVNSGDGLYDANMKGGTQLLLIVIEDTCLILRVGVE